MLSLKTILKSGKAHKILTLSHKAITNYYFSVLSVIKNTNVTMTTLLKNLQWLPYTYRTKPKFLSTTSFSHFSVLTERYRALHPPGSVPPTRVILVPWCTPMSAPVTN